MAFNLGDVLKNVSNSGTGREQITYLPIDNLDSDAGNFYELTGIDALADNISVAGLQQPIRVRAGQEPGRYTIVSGHRRMAACRKLAEDNPEAYREVPCIIETDDASPALQQLRLIYANANTRQLTSAEMSEQAQQVEKLLYELKNEGYEFPGRMRDHVAEAVGASKTKLARLKVIRDKLIPEWTAFWKDNKLPESTAYVLAQADPEYQRQILDNEVRVYGGYDFPIPGLPTVENRLKEMAKSDKLVSGLGCPIRSKSKSKCIHRAPRLQRAAHCGTYDALFCTGCCRDCSSLAYCAFSCELAGDLKKELRGKITTENAAKKAAEKAAEKDRVAAAKALLTKSYGRVRTLREERNIPRTVFLKASTGYMFARDSERLEKLEQGQAMENDRMPGGIWADEAQRLVATADLLGCSVDYLLGREAPAAAAGIWKSGEPEATGDYIVVYDFDHDSKAMIDKMHWDKYDRLWTIFHAPLPDGVTVHLWTEVPEVTNHG